MSQNGVGKLSRKNPSRNIQSIPLNEAMKMLGYEGASVSGIRKENERWTKL